MRRLPKEGPWTNKSLMSYSSDLNIVYFSDLSISDIFIISLLPVVGKSDLAVIQG